MTFEVNSHAQNPAQVYAAQREEMVSLMMELERKPEHSQHVAKLALQIFDQLRSLHGCSDNERNLLEFAALLHDIGWAICGKKHHVHSMRLIEGAKTVKVDYPTKCLIAQIARYHRKSMPKPKHKQFWSLAPNDQITVKKLAAILRIADALDRTHTGRVKKVVCSQVGTDVIITASYPEVLFDESQAFESKKDLFFNVFGTQVLLVNEAMAPELAAAS